jgi:hypothetical protein
MKSRRNRLERSFSGNINGEKPRFFLDKKFFHVKKYMVSSSQPTLPGSSGCGAEAAGLRILQPPSKSFFAKSFSFFVGNAA